MGFRWLQKQGLAVALARIGNLQIIIIISMQGDKILRSAIHAGSWYNQNRIKLAQELEANLSKAEINPTFNGKQIKAIIGPHAGFRYSGPVAAWSYKYFSKLSDKMTRVFLLGPSHYKHLEGVSLSNCHELQTPIGNLKVDVETIGQLRSQIKTVNFSKKDQQKQHSLEMHMPFIRTVFGDNAKVVPIIVGNVGQSSLDALGKVLAKYFDDQNTVFIISSDFCHWGDNFDYQPYQKEKGQIWQFIKSMDHEGMSLIEKQDLKGFTQYLDNTGNTICGQNPIKVLINTMSHSKLKCTTKFVQYDQSQPVKTNQQNSVSYAAAITMLN